jgi:hypothetical protein
MPRHENDTIAASLSAQPGTEVDKTVHRGEAMLIRPLSLALAHRYRLDLHLALNVRSPNHERGAILVDAPREASKTPEQSREYMQMVK